MFTSTDLSLINNPYFTILKLTQNECELQFNNTTHCWRTTPSPEGYYTLHHKHHSQDPYHYQSTSISVEDCLLEIANHDDFQLRRRKPAKTHPTDTFFNHILAVYESI